VTPAAVQASLDELGLPLSQVTFVVVDLETTGGSASDDAITEIGAVKVRGGEVLGEFQTLVRPAAAIPALIAVLTGITDSMVADAPRIDAVLPSFAEFVRGAVLVAHNAPFDLGFLRAASARTRVELPHVDALDTARLARRVLTRDEAPDCRLRTLARLFHATTEPCHRALADARATVDVLHGLLARVGTIGVHSLEDLRAFSTEVTPAQRRKRHLAERVPAVPGVYLFTDGRGEVLYVGKSTNLRARVRAYFTAAETRRRIGEMVGLAEDVVSLPCTTGLEAEIRELRLIAEHKPRYNRRSRFPERSLYLKLTVEPFPRLALVRQVRDDGATYAGPFSAARPAALAMAAVHDTFPLRQCTARLSPRHRSPACALAGMGRCGAPCEGRQDVDAYAAVVAATRTALTTDPGAVVAAGERRIATLARELRFEEAAAHRDRMAAFVRGTARLQRLSALAACPHLVAARPTTGATTGATTGRGWELAVVRHDRLAAAGAVPPAAAARPYVEALVATAETVASGPGPTPAASAEEMECVLRWLEAGARLVELDGVWCSPASGAQRLGRWIEAETTGPRATRPGRAVGASATRSRTRRYADLVITAIVLVKAAVDRIPEVAEAIADLDRVTEVYSVTGDVDLIAMVRVREHEQLADIIADRLNKVPGVLATETHIAFRTYSHHDLEAAFALGFDDAD
jgi:DNA polymerase-3 subunit epsilon